MNWIAIFLTKVLDTPTFLVLVSAGVVQSAIEGSREPLEKDQPSSTIKKHCAKAFPLAFPETGAKTGRSCTTNCELEGAHYRYRVHT